MSGTPDTERTWVRRAGPLGELETDWQRAYYRNAVECFEETAFFVVLFDDFRFEDGWLYVRTPAEREEELAARRTAYNEQAVTWLDKGTDHWEAVIRPEVESHLASMRRTRPRTDALPALVRHLGIVIEHAGRIMGNLHWTMAAGFLPDADGKFAAVAGCDKSDVPNLISGYTHETDRLVRRLRALARKQMADDPTFEDDFARLLQRYGRRNGRGYGSTTTFASPTWAMEPSIARDVIAGYARADIEEAERRERNLRRRRKTAYARLLASLADDDARADLDRYRDVIARHVRAMEDHNHLMEQETVGTLRETVDRVGRALVTSGRLDEPTDVLHLSLAELNDLPGGDLRLLVREREADFERRTQNPPPEFYGPPPSGPPIDLASHAEETPAAAGVLTGVAASAGRATGRAVVAPATHVPPDVEPGDILVARDAGPAWTPIFPLLAGVVLDTGAAFQHAALVAREYGIPAVLGTKTATTTITTGMILTVDGTAGRVEIGPPPT